MFVGQFCMNMYLATMMAHRAPHAAFTLRANAPRSTAAMILITRAMWAQYDHVVPFSRGGNTEDPNIVIARDPCNFGRGFYTLEEVGLADPREREPIHDGWDGLERIMR
jgi:hypothetical protein